MSVVMVMESRNQELRNGYKVDGVCLAVALGASMVRLEQQ